MSVWNIKSTGTYQLTDLKLLTMRHTFFSAVITPPVQVRLYDRDHVDASGIAHVQATVYN